MRFRKTRTSSGKVVLPRFAVVGRLMLEKSFINALIGKNVILLILLEQLVILH
jgi:hypothetical protein